jgi:DsbC/DsbD-like thiol-disulfide interchange protein
VPAAGAAPSSDTLVAAEAALPSHAALGASGAVGIDTVTLESKAVRIEARVAGAEKVDLFVEGPNDDWALPLPTLKHVKDGRAEFLMPVDGVPKGASIAGVPLRFTLIDGNRAVEVEAPLSAP